MLIAVDFDGSIVRHEYPRVGRPIDGAIEWMKKWSQAGAKLILWTMRDKEELDDAIQYCADNGVTFYSHNSNPMQSSWTTSPKCYAHLYVDDAAYGCPLIDEDNSPYIDWSIVGPDVLARIETFYK